MIVIGKQGKKMSKYLR